MARSKAPTPPPDGKGRASKSEGPRRKKQASKRPPARKARRSQSRAPQRTHSKKRAGKSGAAKRRKAVPAGRPRRGGLRRRIGRILLLLAFLGAAALTVDVILLAEAVSERMEGRIHDQPARITGVVPRLAPGDVASVEGWKQTLESLGYREAPRADEVHEGGFHFSARGWSIHPIGGDLLEVRIARSRVKSVRLASSGVRLASWDFPMPAVSVLTGDQRERRSVVPIEDIPLAMVRATVSIEDERFYRHHGLDPRGIARAALRNVQVGGISQGGSTITQQLAKNMFLKADRNLQRKFQEALIALILESRYEKEEILETYLNEIYLGQRDGYAIMGVGEAAQAWFGKDVSSLTVSESALLAGAIRAPNRTVLWKHPEQAKNRRDQVLKKMRELGALPPAELDAALREPLRSAPGSLLRRRAPWFLDAAVAELSDRYTPEALHREGLELVTTLDLRLQGAAEAAVAEGMDSLRRVHPHLWKDGQAPEVALVAMDPSSGAVRALVGGRDYGESQFNRVTQARRQPGSAFKPMVLAAAIGENWPDLRPLSRIADSPLRVPLKHSRSEDWNPRNHDGLFLGPVTLREATEKSRNIPFVRLALDIGIERVQSASEAMGITSPLPLVPSLAIGAAEVSPLELATAYATLANGGLRTRPHYLVGVRGADGEWIERVMPESTAAIDPRVAAVVTNLLEGVIDHGTARQARAAGLRIPLAGKTGTSNESRDAWMAGYSPDLAVVVWVGFDEHRPLGLYSTQAALPIWTGFFRRAESHLAGESFSVPRGTREVLAGFPVRRIDSERREDLEQEDRARRALEDEEMGQPDL